MTSSVPFLKISVFILMLLLSGNAVLSGTFCFSGNGRTDESTIGAPVRNNGMSGPTRNNYWYIEAVDFESEVGDYSSIVLDTEDRPHISYRDWTNAGLKYAYFDGARWHNSTIDADGNVGKYSSIAMDSMGCFHVSYFDGNNKDLKYAYHDGNTWHSQVVDSDGYVGTYTSIGIDGDDNPHICYYDSDSDDLKYAFHNGDDWSIETADSGGNVGMHSSLAVDSEGRPHISYYDSTNKDLKYSYHDGNGWSTGTVDSEGNVGQCTSITLDSGDLPHISYYDDVPNYNLKYAYHDGTEWNVERVDHSENVGEYTSIALDSGDLPHISYVQCCPDSYLKYAYFDGNAWHAEEVDSMMDFTGHTSITLNSRDEPHISYYDRTNNDLKYAAMDNESPSLEADGSPGAGTTGDPYVFNLTVWDDNRVDRVDVNWSHGQLGGDLSLWEVGARWVGTIMLDHDTGNLTYIVQINDSAHHNYHGEVRQVPVFDNDAPTLTEDLTAGTATTGEVFNVSAELADNIGIVSAYIRYVFDDGGEVNCSMDNTIGNIWNCGIVVLGNVTFLNYSVLAIDAAGNALLTTKISYPIGDNDPPVARAGEDLVTDQRVKVTLDATKSSDNIFISNYTWSFLYNGTAYKIYGDLANFSFDIVGTYIVTLKVTDMVGNWAADEMVVTVRDTTPPVAEAREYVLTNQHLNVTFDATESSDNIFISNYTWRFLYNGTDHVIYGIIANFTFDIVGTYIVTLNVTDTVGNWAIDETLVTVRDTTPPEADFTLNAEEAGDDGSFLFEKNDVVVFDAGRSNDNIGIVNYTWSFVDNGKGIELFGPVVEYSFARASIYNVTLVVRDGDENRDTASFKIKITGEVETSSRDLLTWMYIIAIIIVILLCFILLYMVRSRRRNKQLDEPPKPKTGEGDA